MTIQQLIDEATRLSPEDRMALMEAISRSLREEMDSELPLRRGGLAALLGIAKTGAPAPDDDRIRSEYLEYLTEKYR